MLNLVFFGKTAIICSISCPSDLVLWRGWACECGQCHLFTFS